VPIEPGQHLLHYRLIEKIGEGGMGVVWKATDTSLDREVAIKVLPGVFADDAQRLARFEREAKLLAALNHPNIASVYGLHEHQDVRFLAMEYVQGEDLARRLARGPLSVDEALDVARQVAEALQSAHDSGVIHRDLKPANVVIAPAGQAKVLDFGLAKAFEVDPSEQVSPSLSPTLTSAGTVAGVILGTAAYMSPEQARGEPVDKRADIWAFGCVLFEMLTGRMVFQEKTVSDTLASVLKGEPDWSLLRSDVPQSIRRLLQRCLKKDARQRLHDIADARLEIEETLATPADERVVAQSGARSRFPLGLTLLLVAAGLAIGLLVGLQLAPSPSEQRIRRFFLPVDLEPGRRSISGPVLSRDGRRIVYESDRSLWLRDLDQATPRPLNGTDGASMPFWSPDGTQVGFRKEGSLWRIPVGGGQPVLICDESPQFYGASWGDDGRIVFSTLDDIREVAAQGGEPKVILKKNTEKEQHFHEVYQLPGGRGQLVVRHLDEAYDTIMLWAGGKRVDVLTIEGGDLRAPTYSPTGHLLFTRTRESEGLWAVPFSLSRLEVTGEPFLVVPKGAYGGASSDGTLIYVDSEAGSDVELVWFDSQGTILGTIGQPQRDMQDPAVSPDGTQVAVSGKENEDWDIWIHGEGGRKERLTFDKGRELMPHWSPDGSRILYHHPPGPVASIYAVDWDGGGDRKLIIDGRRVSLAQDRIAFVRTGDTTRGDLWWSSLDTNGDAEAFLQTDADESSPALSPNGRFVAYTSDESGTPQVYIRPFPEGSRKWQVSVEHGWHVFWSPKGDRLYYHTYNKVMEVQVSTDPVLRLGTPRLFIDPDRSTLSHGNGIDVTADGKRFVGIRRVETTGEDEVEEGIHVVLNWYSEFRD
jgi:serine/threonine protein kinase